MTSPANGRNRIEAIKAAADILEVASSYTELEQNGQEYVGRCPLPGHEDRNPSFYVNPSKEVWKCRSACDRGGSVIDLVMEVEGKSLGEAADELHSRYGLGVDTLEQGFRDRRERKAGKGKEKPKDEWWKRPHRKTVYKPKDVDGNIIGPEHVRVDFTDGKEPHKRFFWRKLEREDGGKWSPNELPPWGAEDAKDWKPGCRVVWAEGQKARDALADIGVPSLGSYGSGTVPTPEVLRSVLEDHPVTIWRDADEPGVKHARKVADALVDIASETRVFVSGEEGSEDDAADHSAVVSGDREGIEELQKQLEAAPFAQDALPKEDQSNVRQLRAVSGGKEGNRSKKPKQPTDDELRDVLLADGVDYAFGLGEWRRYENGIWPAISELEVKDHACRIAEKAKSLGVRPSRSLVSSIAGLTQMRVAVRDAEWDSDDDLLVCQNGALRVSTRTLEPHEPDHRATFAVPYDYDPAARAPTWERFVAERFSPEVAAFLQEFAGYCLTTDVSHEIAVWLYGPPGGGRSTFILGLETMLGERADTLGLRAIERSQFALSTIPGRTLLTATEQPAGYTEVTDILNALISGDRIHVERKYHDAFELYPKAKLLWAMNSLPRVSGPDDGLFRRINVIEMAPIPLDQVDTKVKGRIANEGPGILNWSLVGNTRLRARGYFQIPDEVKAATEDYRKTNDVPAAFIADVCATGSDLSERAHPLYEAYRKWCAATGHRAQSETSMAKEWQRLGFKKYTSAGRNRYRGVSVKMDALEELEETR